MQQPGLLYDQLVAAAVPAVLVRASGSTYEVVYGPEATPQQIAAGEAIVAGFSEPAAERELNRVVAKRRARKSHEGSELRALARLLRSAINNDRQWMATVRTNLLGLGLVGLTLPAAPSQVTWEQVLTMLDNIIDAGDADPER